MKRENICIFVQNNLVEKLTAPVAIFAREEGYSLIDRSSTANLDIDNCGIDWSRYSHVLPYGSVQFVRKLAISSLAAHLDYSDSAFDAATWKKELGPNLLNCDFLEMTVGECRTHLRASNTGWHIRPKFEGKSFNGGVYDCESWVSTMISRNLSADALCIVSPVRPIKAEWRVWVVGSNVIEISQYRQSEQMHFEVCTDAEVWKKAQELASKWLPFENVVMDLALTQEGFFVIEFNPIHSSGWYAASPSKILEAWVSQKTMP